MAISVIAGPIIANGGPSGADTTLTPRDTTSANLIVLGISSYLAVTSVSDSFGNTYTPIGSQESGVNGAQLFYCASPTVGAGHTFSTVAAYSTLYVIAVSGAAVSPLDQQTGGANGGSVTSFQPGSITPTANGCLVVTSLGYYADAGTASIDGSFAALSIGLTGGTNYAGGSAYEIQPTITAVNPTWSWGSGEPVGAVIASFLPAAGGGGVTPSFASTLGAATLASSAVFSDPSAFAVTLGGSTLAVTAAFSTPAAFAPTLGNASLAATAAFSDPAAFASTLGGASLAAAAVFSDPSHFAATLGGATLASAAVFTPTGGCLFAATLGSVTLASAAVTAGGTGPLVLWSELFAIALSPDDDDPFDLDPTRTIEIP